MKNKHLYMIWGLLYVLCTVLGFILGLILLLGGLVGGVVGLYCTVGWILAILDYMKVLK